MAKGKIFWTDLSGQPSRTHEVRGPYPVYTHVCLANGKSYVGMTRQNTAPPAGSQRRNRGHCSQKRKSSILPTTRSMRKTFLPSGRENIIPRLPKRRSAPRSKVFRFRKRQKQRFLLRLGNGRMPGLSAVWKQALFTAVPGKRMKLSASTVTVSAAAAAASAKPAADITGNMRIDGRLSSDRKNQKSSSGVWQCVFTAGHSGEHCFFR